MIPWIFITFILGFKSWVLGGSSYNLGDISVVKFISYILHVISDKSICTWLLGLGISGFFQKCSLVTLTYVWFF